MLADFLGGVSGSKPPSSTSRWLDGGCTYTVSYVSCMGGVFAPIGVYTVNKYMHVKHSLNTHHN